MFFYIRVDTWLIAFKTAMTSASALPELKYGSLIVVTSNLC
jgi:hypothetical protein